MHTRRSFGANLTAAAADPVATRGAGTAHPAADHRPAAAIAAALAVDAGFVLLATVVMGGVTVLAANTSG